MNIRDRQILQIALPSIVSNITVPLLGMIDVAIVGHMGSPAYIGAVAVGSMIFNLVYWLFGFLRMGSSGLTSQALGRRDLTEVASILARSVFIAFSIALLLILLQIPMKWASFALIGPTEDVVPFASTYFNIVIWGAPAVLGLYSMLGWFIGMQNTRFPMFISIMQNVVNILASLTLVYGFGMKIEGVAMGTVIAQYAGFIVALGLVVRYYGRLFREYGGTGARRYENTSATDISRAPVPTYLRTPEISKFFRINRDIFLRTLCLVAVNLYFTSAGARQGAVILSVNTVMMQLYLFFSYFMDGFAYAGEALGGKAYGAKNTTAFHETLRRLRNLPRLSVLGVADTCGWLCRLHLGRRIHRPDCHPRHARLIVSLRPRLFCHLSYLITLSPLLFTRKPLLMAGNGHLPRHEGHPANNLVPIKNI